MSILNKEQLLEGISRKAFFKEQEVGDIDFTGHIFDYPVDLAGVHFVGHTNFSGAIFQQGASFKNCIFHGYTNFSGCHFLPSRRFFGAIFDLSNFEKELNFQACWCEGQFRFWGVHFHEKADFSGIVVGDENSQPSVFDGHANFSWSWFHDKAIFTGAHFYWPAQFYRTLFDADVMFDICEFKDLTRFIEDKNEVHFPRSGLLRPEILKRLEDKGLFQPDTEVFLKVIQYTSDRVPRQGKAQAQNLTAYFVFRGVKSTDNLIAQLNSFRDINLHERDKLTIIETWKNGARKMFPDRGIISFRDTRFEQPQVTEFKGVSMENVVCKGSDIGFVVLTGVQWPTQAFNDIFPGRRSSVHDENFAKSTEECHEIASIYSDLEKNYSASNNKVEARDFHYGQMEMLWKANKSIGKYFSLSAFYKYVTGYGSRYQLPILWLLICLFLLFPTVYTLNSYTAQQGMAEQFGNAILRSLEVVTFRSDVVGYIEWLERFLIGGLLFLSGRAISSHIPSDG